MEISTPIGRLARDQGAQLALLLRDLLGQHPGAGLVKITAAHLPQIDLPFFDPRPGAVLAKSGIVGPALLVCPEVQLKLIWVGAFRNVQNAIFRLCGQLVSLLAVKYGMAIPDEGLIAQDAQAFELPDVGRKIGAGFYLAVGLMDLIEGEHGGMV